MDLIRCNDQQLFDKGYYDFATNSFDHQEIEKHFQKRIEDENGIKYYITIDKWKPYKHQYTGDCIDMTYEFNVQLIDKTTENPYKRKEEKTSIAKKQNEAKNFAKTRVE